MTSLDRNWLILQLTDSAFPAGAFAHSGGLEAAWQLGEVQGATGLTDFLRAALLQTAVTTAPLVNLTCKDPSRLLPFDQFCDAMLTNTVTNQASRSQGRALLAAAERVFKSDRLGDIHRSLRNAGAAGHLPVTFGAVHAAMELDAESAVGDFLFVGLRGMVSAAVRLGIVGPLEGQSIQYALSKESPAWVASCLAIDDVEDIAALSPVMDFYQSLQHQLYSRLFIS